MKVTGRLRWGRKLWIAICATIMFVFALSITVLADESPNETCLSCHDNEGFTNTLDNGDEMNLYVSGSSYLNSVHGSMEQTCDTCHEGYVEYPHPEKTFASARGFEVQVNASCANCHVDQAAAYKDEFHGKTLALRQQRSLTTGKSLSVAPEATCADCHGSHDILRTDDPASRVYPDNVATTCQSCHEKATPKFALAFSGHKSPTPSEPRSAVTYWINAFYKLVIPALLGSLVLFMILELTFMLRRRQRTSS